MKSTMIMPERFRSRSWNATSSAASRLMLRYVSEEAPSWEIITDQRPLYEQIMHYEKENALDVPVRLYQDSMLSLSALYGIEGKLKPALVRGFRISGGSARHPTKAPGIPVPGSRLGLCPGSLHPAISCAGVPFVFCRVLWSSILSLSPLSAQNTHWTGKSGWSRRPYGRRDDAA